MDKMALRKSQEIPNHSKRWTGAQIDLSQLGTRPALTKSDRTMLEQCCVERKSFSQPVRSRRNWSRKAVKQKISSSSTTQGPLKTQELLMGLKDVNVVVPRFQIEFVHVTTPRQVLEKNLPIFHPEFGFWDTAVNMTEIKDEPRLPFRINGHWQRIDDRGRCKEFGCQSHFEKIANSRGNKITMFKSRSVIRQADIRKDSLKGIT